MNVDPRILCVDDHPASRAVFKLLLTDMLGYTRVRIMPCSEDLVERLTTDHVELDVIFLDLSMEPLDGITLLGQFRASMIYREVPIVACTASAAPDELEEIRKAGFDGAVAKPIDPRIFQTLVSRILNKEAVWESTM